MLNDRRSVTKVAVAHAAQKTRLTTAAAKIRVNVLSHACGGCFTPEPRLTVLARVRSLLFVLHPTSSCPHRAVFMTLACRRFLSSNAVLLEPAPIKMPETL